jgi:hypothetical protein
MSANKVKATPVWVTIEFASVEWVPEGEPQWATNARTKRRIRKDMLLESWMEVKVKRVPALKA